MSRPRRVEEGAPTDARELAERIGYARCETDEADRTLEALRQKQQDLRRQIAAVDAENRVLERDLLQQLSQWRKLDDGQQRVEELLPQLRSVTSSLTYRLVAGLLAGINRMRSFLLPTRRKAR